MTRRITVNVGFITNSSSCVYYFPREILDDPQIKSFMEAHELSNGYMGGNLWSRSQCSSVLVTPEQKAEAKKILSSYDWEDSDPDAETTASRSIDPKDDGVYLIYGDEYSDTTHILCRLMSDAFARLHNTTADDVTGFVTDYN